MSWKTWTQNYVKWGTKMIACGMCVGTIAQLVAIVMTGLASTGIYVKVASWWGKK